MKEFLSQRGVSFQEKKVFADPGALDEMIEFGVLSAPLLVINGRFVRGYDPHAIQRLLEVEGLISL